MKKVKLGLQRGYSRNMPPKVFNGASDVCFAGKNGANEGGRSDSAKLWWGHFRYMMFQDRGGQTWPEGKFQWSAEEAIQHRNSLLRFCWEVFSRMFVLSLCIKCWEVKRVEGEIRQ